MSSWARYLQPLQGRWQALAQRERWALSLLFGFLGLTLLYVLLWQPVSERLEQARQLLQQQRNLNAYMHEHAQRIQSAADLQPSQLSADALQGLLTSSAASHQLQVERLQRQGEQTWQMNLQPVAFVRLLEWLQYLQVQGVRIDEAALERAGEGHVRTRLLLSAGI